MKLRHYYWISIAIFAVIHIERTGTALFGDFSFLISIIIAGIASFLLYKQMRGNIGELGAKTNGLLYSLQIMIVLLYLLSDPGWVYSIPFLLFVGIEAIRHRISRQLYRNNLLLRSQKEEMEQMNETFLIVRKERHDFLKHISALHYMLENKKSEEAKTYLDELVEGYKETNLSIQGERGAIAGVLHQHYREGKSKGMDVTYDLETALSSFPLDDHDLTALVGNILGNALEAGAEWQDVTGSQAHIVLQAYKRSGLYMLNCKNHTVPLPGDVLDRLFTKQAVTTKTGEHEGLGTQIINEIVRKYAGHLDFTHKNKTFTLHIKLPAIKR